MTPWMEYFTDRIFGNKMLCPCPILRVSHSNLTKKVLLTDVEAQFVEKEVGLCSFFSPPFMQINVV